MVFRGLGCFVAPILMYLGVPLLGWGVGDLGGFFAAGPRLVHGLVVLPLGVAVGWQAIRSPEGIRDRLALTFNSWIGPLGSTGFVGIVLFRIRDEEALTEEASGRERDAYCEETQRLPPFVY